MSFLIVAATKMEVAGFSEFLHKNSKNLHNQVHLLITGVGMVPTTYAMSTYLAREKSMGTSADDQLGKSNIRILNVGIAGTFDKNLALGSLVRVHRDTFSEWGAENHDDFLSINDLGFGENSFFGTYVDESPLFSALPQVSALTVNCVHGNAQSIAYIQHQHPEAKVESMEGAAVFYVAQQFGIPCAQIRAISNLVEPRNRDTWKIPEAIDELNTWLIQFVESKIP